MVTLTIYGHIDQISDKNRIPLWWERDFGEGGFLGLVGMVGEFFWVVGRENSWPGLAGVLVASNLISAPDILCLLCYIITQIEIRVCADRRTKENGADYSAPCPFPMNHGIKCRPFPFLPWGLHSKSPALMAIAVKSFLSY